MQLKDHYGQWLITSVVMVANAVSILDRALLASLAPVIKSDFTLSNAEYGALVSVFYAITVVSGPAAGLFIDRIGLRLGAIIAMTIWSLASALTGFTSSFRGLALCRGILALGESAGSAVPGAVLARYVPPATLGISGALLGVGTTLGAIATPLIVSTMAPRYGWRFVFVVCGLIGVLWVPIWLLSLKLVSPRSDTSGVTRPLSLKLLLKDRRLWWIGIAYAFATQTLWLSWTTIYFVQERHLTLAQANRYFAWYPSVFSTVGAFGAGALSLRLIRRGSGGMIARLRVCYLMAPLLLTTALVPLMPSPFLAAVAIGVSSLAGMGIASTIHVLPIDVFGAHRAAFTYSVLACAFALMQMLMSPMIGRIIDRFGFPVACTIMTVVQLVSILSLRLIGTVVTTQEAHPAKLAHTAG